MSRLYAAAECWKDFKEIVEIDIDGYVKGDANGDGVVNAADVVAIVNYLLNKAESGFNEKAADVNGDGLINVADLVQLANIVYK